MRTLLFLASLAALLGCKSPPGPEDAAARIVALEEENALLRDQLESLRTQFEVLALRLGVVQTNCDFGPIPCVPQIDAIVLDVNEANNHVVLDKGLDAKVDVGYRFDVFRDSTYKGQVRVESVARWTCSGVILRQLNPITKGDSATTHL